MRIQVPGGGITRQLWHEWFAWRPVRLRYRYWVWLEWIERKGTRHFNDGWPPNDWWTWEYRDHKSRRP